MNMPPASHPAAVVRAVDVCPCRLTGTKTELLLLKRAPDVVYAGTWRMVGEKIAAGERAHETALREEMEETSQRPTRLWTLPSVNTFYEWPQERVTLAPAFAAVLAGDPVLNHEHQAFAWLPVDEAAARLTWPEQQRLLRLTAHLEKPVG
jgi:dihydroneopterin triphosphate diphosphatase